ncbi:MAG: beta-N-acetylglucosaminidase domain-containing protein [Nitrospira sp.]
MFGIGLIEGFFGPEWPWKSRHRFCKSLRAYGGAFYLYAPKRDGCLRKNWKQHHEDDVWNEIKRLGATCRRNQTAFGIGLSPYEIHSDWNLRTKTALRDKIERVHELDITFLCLLLDDMKGASDLADRQVEIVEYVRSMMRMPLVFCPTYYSDDPILDKVFGQRPDDYLEKIGRLSNDIHIFLDWQPCHFPINF